MHVCSLLPKLRVLALCVGVGSTACAPSPSAPGVPDDPESLGELDAGGLPPPTLGGGGGGPEPIDCANSTGSQDGDDDGFSRAKGDCDDCEPGLSPGALDIPGNGMDEDCDGKDATSGEPACDAPLKAESTDAEDAAQALGICETHSLGSRLPGLVEAQWSRLGGGAQLDDPRQVWLPEKFGSIGAREGQRLLALSTGVARDVRDKAYTEDCDVFGSTRLSTGGWSNSAPPPDGYPLDESRCKPRDGSGTPVAYNDVALELTLRAPGNARSFSFDSIFFTQEYPDFVCSEFNDFFVVFVDPAPPGNKDGNVLFDADGDTIGVNTGLLAVCREADSGRVARPVPCESGPALLAGTGFDAGESRCASKQTSKRDIGGAATGWLQTTVPVKAGKIVRIRFVLWDTGDPVLDSTVLLDNFRWSLEEPAVGTRPISN